MSLRAIFLVRCLIAAICLLSVAARAGDTRVKKTPFGTGAEVGFGLVKYRNACSRFRVVFISGDFFKDLQERKTHGGIEFRKRKGKTTYVSFPEPLVVDLEAIPQKCNGGIPPLDYAAALMERSEEMHFVRSNYLQQKNTTTNWAEAGLIF